MNQPISRELRDLEIKPPSLLNTFREFRAMISISKLPLLIAKNSIRSTRKQSSARIMLFPGFGAGERSMKPLQWYLQTKGYQAEGWGLGTNYGGFNLNHTLEDLSPRWNIDFPNNYSKETYKGEGGVAFLCDKAIAQVETRSKELNSPLILIGWSLGGYIARECARELPKQVSQVITFGTPIFGGPKYSCLHRVFKSSKLDLDWIEESILQREMMSIKQPITVIYSKSDGVVSRNSAVDITSQNVNNIEVSTAHFGMGFDADVWKIISDTLAKSVTPSDPSQ